jgi:hypothetical protein
MTATGTVLPAWWPPRAILCQATMMTPVAQARRCTRMRSVEAAQHIPAAPLRLDPMAEIPAEGKEAELLRTRSSRYGAV